MDQFEIIVNAVLFHGPKNIEIFPIRVTSDKYLKIKKQLKIEQTKIINYLKKLRDQGVINSICRPSKSSLRLISEQVNAKKEIKESIKKITTIFK